jgi:branched-chain amino acid transport system substrate-binding protein
MRALTWMGVLALLATGCSFTTAAGLDQCETSTDCASDQVCTRNVCLPLPIGCNEKPFGSTDPGAIAMGALVSVHTSTAPGAGVDESDEQALNAILLALEELNQRGVSGRQLALYYCDTASDVERARKQAEWMVNDKKIAAVVTAGSSQTLEVAKVTINKNVLLMSYSASSSELTVLADTHGGPVGLVWRTSPSDAIQGSVITHLLRTDSRFGPQTTTSKVGILYVDDPYGQGLANIISDQLLSGDVSQRVPNRTFSYPKHGDVKSAIDQLEMYAPNLTVLIGFADDATAILKEAATRPNLQRIPDGPHRWFFSDSVKDKALMADTQAAAQAEGFYGTAPAQGTGLAFNTFQNRFRDRYGNDKNPAEYAYTSNAYDAMYLLALSASWALGRSDIVTGPALAEGLTQVSTGTPSAQTQLTNSNFTYLSTELAAGRSVNVDGASGQLDFDAHGEASSPVELWQVEAASFKTISSTLYPP